MMYKPEDTGEPTLGDILKQTLAEIAESKITGSAELAAANVTKIRKMRERRLKFVEKIRSDITKQITSQRIPRLKFKTPAQKLWLIEANNGKAEFQELWNALIRDMGNEKLRINVDEEDDGFGTSSTIVVTVTPSQNKVVYRGTDMVPAFV